MKKMEKVSGVLCVVIMILIAAAGCGAGIRHMEHAGDEDSDSGKNAER